MSKSILEQHPDAMTPEQRAVFDLEGEKLQLEEGIERFERMFNDAVEEITRIRRLEVEARAENAHLRIRLRVTDPELPVSSEVELKLCEMRTNPPLIAVVKHVEHLETQLTAGYITAISDKRSNAERTRDWFMRGTPKEHMTLGELRARRRGYYKFAKRD